MRMTLREFFGLCVATITLSVLIVATFGVRGAGAAIVVTFVVSGIVNVTWHIMKNWRG